MLLHKNRGSASDMVTNDQLHNNDLYITDFSGIHTAPCNTG